MHISFSQECVRTFQEKDYIYVHVAYTYMLIQSYFFLEATIYAHYFLQESRKKVYIFISFGA